MFRLAMGIVKYLTILLFIIPAIANGHPIQFIALETVIVAENDRVNVKLSIPYEFNYPSEDERERLIFINAYFTEHFLVESFGRSCVGEIERVYYESQNTRFDGNYICPESLRSIDDIGIRSTLWFEIFDDTNNFVSLEIAGVERSFLLDKNNTDINADSVEKKIGFFTVLRQFFGLGIPHVLFGLDHVLFVLALHTIVRKFRDIIAIITAFTIAHSITLFLGGLGIVVLGSYIVEPLIAFSIAYVAFRNIEIIKNGELGVMKGRWAASFGFGLIHGLGFAGALAKIKIPEEHFVTALLSFNFGIETGQLVIVGLFVPLLYIMNRIGILRQSIYVISSAILIISLTWTVERIFF